MEKCVYCDKKSVTVLEVDLDKSGTYEVPVCAGCLKIIADKTSTDYATSTHN